MAERPTLFVCHGDTGGPKLHPCRRVQEAMQAAGIEYEKVIGGHGSPWPFLRRGSREFSVHGDLAQRRQRGRAPTFAARDFFGDFRREMKREADVAAHVIVRADEFVTLTPHER